MRRQNRVKATLRAGGTVVGSFLKLPALEAAEAMALASFDFLVVDLEHTPLDYETAQMLVAACEGPGAVPLLRVAENRPVEVLRALDVGALGVHVPQVQTREQAEQAVRAVRYGPAGRRGLSLSHRAAGYGLRAADEYLREAAEELLLVVHVEDEEGVVNVAEIAGVEGVDVVFLGLADLSNALGVPHQLDHPRVQQAAERVLSVCRRSGVPVGVFVGSADQAQRLHAQGARYIVFSSDIALLASAGRQARLQLTTALGIRTQE